MIRAFVYMLQLAAIVAVAVWLADQPGAVSVRWGQDFIIETSVGMLVLIVALLMGLAGFGYHLWRRTLGLGRELRSHQQQRRREKGYRAAIQGLVAAASGNAAAAEKGAADAQKLLEDPSLSLLLGAQAAQLTGDDQAARKAFADLARNPETAFLGIRGLLTQAIRRADWPQALKLARRANQIEPNNAPVVSTLFGLEIRAGELAAADRILAEAIKLGVWQGAVAQRHQAALALARADAAEDPETALAEAQRAHSLLPSFVPAAVAVAHHLHKAGKDRAAEKALAQAWKAGAHPELASAWAALAGEDATARIKQLQKLVAIDPSQIDGRLALAEAALDSSLWGEARDNLIGLLASIDDKPQAQRAYRLMARLEREEDNDVHSANAWLEKAAGALPPPVWACEACGTVHQRWQAVCSHCAAFDRIEWRSGGAMVHEPLRIEDLSPTAAASA